MAPQIKQPVSARRYFPQDLLGRQASKKLVRPFGLRLPHLHPEGYIRSFVFHNFISFRPRILGCTFAKTQQKGFQFQPSETSRLSPTASLPVSAIAVFSSFADETTIDVRARGSQCLASLTLNSMSESARR